MELHGTETKRVSCPLFSFLLLKTTILVFSPIREYSRVPKYTHIYIFFLASIERAQIRMVFERGKLVCLV